jgi:hypothetical protein
MTAEGEVLGGELLPKSISALMQALREQQKSDWARSWRSALVGDGLRSIDPRPPGAAFVKPLHSLSRRNATRLSRFRLNFNGLGATKPFLDASSPERLCECEEEETREHVLLEYRRYEEARRELRKKMGNVELSVRSVFSPVFITPLFCVLHSTERFPRFFCLFHTTSPPSPSLV